MRNDFTGEKNVSSCLWESCKGREISDDSDLISEELTATIDMLCNEFLISICRLDIRFNSWKNRKRAAFFSDRSQWGRFSELLIIYDPRHSFPLSWKESFVHWIILWRISRINHRRGFPYLTYVKGLQCSAKTRSILRRLAAMKVWLMCEFTMCECADSLSDLPIEFLAFY